METRERYQTETFVGGSSTLVGDSAHTYKLPVDDAESGAFGAMALGAALLLARTGARNHDADGWRVTPNSWECTRTLGKGMVLLKVFPRVSLYESRSASDGPYIDWVGEICIGDTGINFVHTGDSRAHAMELVEHKAVMLVEQFGELMVEQLKGKHGGANEESGSSD